MNKMVYDIEVLPNVFTCTGFNPKTNKTYVFEISPRKNDFTKFTKWINKLIIYKYMMVGFNNVHYDYPVIHHMLTSLNNISNAKSLTASIHNKSQAIFTDSRNGNKFAHTIWDNQCLVPQIDLFKIHHFDNMARSTSLKRLQFNMRLQSIKQFEVPFDEPVKKSSTINSLLEYNKHDITTTNDFLNFSKSQVEFRKLMSDKYDKHFYNYNDTKIGEEYTIMQLKDKVGQHILYVDTERGRIKRMTERTVMDIEPLIFNYIKFKNKEFQNVLQKLKSYRMFVIKGKFHWNENLNYPYQMTKIKSGKTKLAHLRKLHRSKKCSSEQVELFKNKLESIKTTYADHHVSCDINGFTFEFGKGGLHGTLRNTYVESTKDRLILDLDVTSYYPAIAIENGLYPEHLTSAFCPIYAEQKAMRSQYQKGTPENAMLKLALNGTYGKTNSNYSVFYDPAYTVTTTINGQLMLCMLWESIMRVKNTKIIQANTDGITILIDKERKGIIDKLCKRWERLTKLELEEVNYKRMWIRDGNNYIAEYENGDLKQKGCYLYKSLFHGKGFSGEGVEWHKNHSMLIVQKAVESELVYGKSASEFIIQHRDIYDFFLCTNVPGAYDLMIGDGIITAKKSKGELVIPAELGPLNVKVQNITRYLISNSNDQLTKVMPPLKGKVHKRFSAINKGYKVSVYNEVISENVDDYDINYQFYIDEANKLLTPFREDVRYCT